VRLLPPLPRTLVALGWIVYAAGNAVFSIKILSTLHGHDVWRLYAELVSAPLYLLIFSVAWWLLGTVSIVDGSDARAASRAMTTFALASIVAAVGFLVEYLGSGSLGGGASYLAYKWLTGLGPLIVASGLIAGAVVLRRDAEGSTGTREDETPRLAGE
jgi:hypothetical protein